MYLAPNVERLKRLRLAGYALKEQIAFCPTCDFQYEPKTMGKNECPTCRCDLHVTTMSLELVALVARESIPTRQAAAPMKIYEVWAHDPMDGSMGADYIAARYFDKDKADADAAQRNANTRLRFEREADDGLRRAEKEPWNWMRSHVVEADVIA